MNVHFQDFDGDNRDCSQREKLQKDIRERKRSLKNWNTDTKVAKNGLWTKDLLQMAWKMLKRRGSLQPFRGHRERGELIKRELSFL